MVEFGVKNNVYTCICLGIYICENSFNTLTTDEQERAKRVVSELIMPIAHKVNTSIKNTGFKYLGITGCYCKKEFTDRIGSSERGCAVIISCGYNYTITERGSVSNKK